MKYWSNEENHKDFMDWLGKELNFKKMDDWYNISQKAIGENGGGSLLNKYNSLFNLVSSIYPQYKWNKFRFSSKIKW